MLNHFHRKATTKPLEAHRYQIPIYRKHAQFMSTYFTRRTPCTQADNCVPRVALKGDVMRKNTLGKEIDHLRDKVRKIAMDKKSQPNCFYIRAWEKFEA
ncbi:hypothetical protein TNCV_1400931 [Trichonephila clavipes]|nr:hypothetical protein TNCV_1400931 [Trichonephila clavipes]